MSQHELFEMEWGNSNLKNTIEIDATFLFQEIERQLSEYLLDEKGEGDSTDGVFPFIENLTNNLQTEFDESMGEDGQKRHFIRSLTKIFAILLNTRVDTVDKIKKIIKIAVNTTIKLWSEQN